VPALNLENRSLHVHLGETEGYWLVIGGIGLGRGQDRGNVQRRQGRGLLPNPVHGGSKALTSLEKGGENSCGIKTLKVGDATPDSKEQVAHIPF